MPFFATTYRYADDSTEALDATRSTHRDYLAGLVEAGSLTLSGPYVGGAAGALLLFEVETEQDVRALVDADPFVVEGLVTEITVREWLPVLGRVSQHL